MIWQRYFIREVLKTFALLITTFFGLYILIDYASHPSATTWSEWLRYYLSDFTKRMDVLIPFALLIATVRTLTQLNMHHELTALLASGISLNRLMRPFLLIGFAFTLLIYINYQFFLPAALPPASQKAQKSKRLPVNHFLMPDGSTVLFHDYQNGAFNDLYWIKTPDEIYHARTLKDSVGASVDHIVRSDKGYLYLAEHLPAYDFPPFDQEQLRVTVTPPSDLSLSTLFQQIPAASSKNSEKESFLLTAFYTKLALPWLCLFAVIGPMPLCLRFTRTLPLFFIYSFSIFSLVALYLILDAAMVLGKRQVLWPAAAIWIPMGSFFLLFGFRYIRRLTTV